MSKPIRCGEGFIQIDPEKGDRLCWVCETDEHVMFLRFTNPTRARSSVAGGTGQMYLRLCKNCLSALCMARMDEQLTLPQTNVVRDLKETDRFIP